MTKHIKCLSLSGYDGPNRYGPHPMVALTAHATTDLVAQLRSAVKQAAQQVGIVVGSLTVTSEPVAQGVLLTLHFKTPTPALGAELVRLVVAGLNAQIDGDSTWDAEEVLWELQQRRRREALPLAVLQLLAEAATRRLPAFVLHGRLQIGYGCNGWSLPLTELTGQPAMHGSGPFAPASRVPPWEQIGTIPIVALVGGDLADHTARLVADAIGTTALVSAGFDATRQHLCEPQTEVAVMSLAEDDLAMRGVPFDRCRAAAILALPAGRPAAIAARIAGVVTLLTDPAGVVVLAGHDPAIAALMPYPRCRVESLGVLADEQLVQQVAILLRHAVV